VQSIEEASRFDDSVLYEDFNLMQANKKNLRNFRNPFKILYLWAV